MAGTPKQGATCGGKLKGGKGRCQRPAGWGTQHPGTGACKLHGGASPSHYAKNAMPQLALLTGYNVDVSPMEALLMCVRISAAEIAYFSGRIDQLEEKDVVVRPRKEQVAGKDPEVFDLKQEKQLNLWIRARHQAMERLARFSKMALDAGVEERLVRVAENVGNQLAMTLEAIINELQLNDEQMARAPEVIRKQLMLMEGKAA